MVYDDIYDAKVACDHLSGFNVANRYLIVLYYRPGSMNKKVRSSSRGFMPVLSLPFAHLPPYSGRDKRTRRANAENAGQVRGRRGTACKTGKRRQIKSVWKPLCLYFIEGGRARCALLV